MRQLPPSLPSEADKIEVDRDIDPGVATPFRRAYYEFAYGLTKAALEPVVAALCDVLVDAFSRSVRDGVQDAVFGGRSCR